jgi:hypothetical protein
MFETSVNAIWGARGYAGRGAEQAHRTLGVGVGIGIGIE